MYYKDVGAMHWLFSWALKMREHILMMANRVHYVNHFAVEFTHWFLNLAAHSNYLKSLLKNNLAPPLTYQIIIYHPQKNIFSKHF